MAACEHNPRNYICMELHRFVGYLKQLQGLGIPLPTMEARAELGRTLGRMWAGSLCRLEFSNLSTPCARLAASMTLATSLEILDILFQRALRRPEEFKAALNENSSIKHLVVHDFSTMVAVACFCQGLSVSSLSEFTALDLILPVRSYYNLGYQLGRSNMDKLTLNSVEPSFWKGLSRGLLGGQQSKAIFLCTVMESNDMASILDSNASTLKISELNLTIRGPLSREFKRLISDLAFNSETLRKLSLDIKPDENDPMIVVEDLPVMLSEGNRRLEVFELTCRDPNMDDQQWLIDTQRAVAENTRRRIRDILQLLDPKHSEDTRHQPSPFLRVNVLVQVLLLAMDEIVYF